MLLTFSGIITEDTHDRPVFMVEYRKRNLINLTSRIQNHEQALLH